MENVTAKVASITGGASGMGLPGDSKITLSGGNPDEVATDADREERMRLIREGRSTPPSSATWCFTPSARTSSTSSRTPN